MPFLHHRQPIPSTGRATARLSTRQRDLLLSSKLSDRLSYPLQQAAVAQGKLSARFSLAELEEMIAALAVASAEAEPARRRDLDKLADYLEGLADQFATPEPNHEASAP
jgi:hypothetical protein